MLMLDTLREMAQKKYLEIRESNDLEVLETIEEVMNFLKNDGCFQKIDAEIAYGVLSFLGVPTERLKCTHQLLLTEQSNNTVHGVKVL